MKQKIDVFDGHCDTLYRGIQLSGEGHLDLKRMSAYRHYAQFFAIWTDSASMSSEDLCRFVTDKYDYFLRVMAQYKDCITFCRCGNELRKAFASGKMAAFLSVEGAELLDCSLLRLEQAWQQGIRAVNLTWNHANALSGSCADQPEKGLTQLGKTYVRKMESLGMIVDVSHLSEAGFWDVAETLSGPFVASHSNAKALQSHCRNLTDEQFTAIIEHNGVVGLNLYSAFLGDRPDIDTAVAHLEHWLDLGGAGQIAIGADFDGCDCLPDGIAGVQHLEKLWNRLLQRNYDETLLRALFFENLMRVVSEVCTM